MCLKNINANKRGMVNKYSWTPFTSNKGDKKMPAQAKKRAAKPKKIVKPKAPAKKKPALECGVCGYRVVVDEACGCVEEHVLVCCGQPMGKKKA